MEILIIGHKNPDTDSIVSAIAYAYLKNKTDNKNSYLSGAAGEIDKDTRFILNYFKQESPKIINDLSNWDGGLIILDHMESSQSVKGLKEDKIIEFIDHHRLGDMQTPDQVFARIEPIGSTSTIISKIFKEKKIIPSEEMAGLLISGIISDTLFLKSPTTTDEDKKEISDLNKICKIKSLEDFAEKIFEAKSDISQTPVLEIITRDYKDFNFGGKKIGIGLCETLKPQNVLKIKEDIIKELIKFKDKNNLDLLYFLVVDILNQKSEMMVINDKEKQIAEKVFGGETKDNILFMGNRVSRKKEIVPPLENFLNKPDD